MSGPVCPKCGGVDLREEKVEGGRWTRWRCRTCQAAEMRRRRKRLPYEPLYDGARQRARKAGVPFELTHEDVQACLADWTCSYCDQPVGSFSGGTRPNSATLDRLVPSDGYTPDNTVVACHQCNAAKSDHTPSSLRAWADRIEAVIHRKHQHEES